MADTNTSKLQQKPWKVWMSSAPEPSAVLTTAQALVDGSRLGHDLLILNENVYSAGVFNGNYEQFYRYAIDLSPAVFDKRAKIRVESLDIASICPFGTLANADPISFYVQDTDAAIYPEDLKTSFAVNSTWKRYFRYVSTLAEQDTTTSYQTSEMFTVLAKATDVEVSSDIIVTDNDDVFSSTMVFEDGKKAYTTVGIQQTAKITKFLLGAILFNSDAASKLDNVKNDISILTEAQLQTIYNNIAKTKIGDVSLLNYIHIWVKAPFCADYIDPSDFNQNLNQDSDVIFRNLLIANNYDGVRNNFNRYTESRTYTDTTTITDFLEKMSRPYCPTNSPMKDLLSDKLIALAGAQGDTIRETAAKLIKDSYADESYIGSVLVSPISSTSGETTRYTPFNYYDPESRDDEDFYADLGKLPTIIGRDGNLTIDGRIMSPTIDEIWYIIYKLVLGHSDESSSIISTPKSSYYMGKDTSLREAASQFTWSQDGSTIKGNPIDYAFSQNSDGETNGISVTEWVTNPEETNLHIDRKISDTSDIINTFFDAQNAADKGSRSIYQTGGEIALKTKSTYNIENFTASDQEYGPRSVPLSLRELEAAILGVKYNVDNNFIFNSKTYAVTGKFGKVEKDENDTIIAAGSLYQLHREYNGDVANPNTVFKLGGVKNTEDASFGDLNGKTELNGKIPVYLLDKNHKRTTTIKSSSMPLMVENYGKSVTLSSEQGEYTGADVYMAADGTWRYKAEHMRLPILRSRY